MKLFEIADTDTTSSRITDEQMELAYKAIRTHEFDRNEIRDLAKEFGEREDFGRTKGSAEFVLNRMHILVHGIAPHGETEKRAETMFNISPKMAKFAESKGIDVDENVTKAREEVKTRKVKVKKPAATKMMADYYKEHKADLPSDIAKSRDKIIADIMDGEAVADVFAKYSK